MSRSKKVDDDLDLPEPEPDKEGKRSREAHENRRRLIAQKVYEAVTNPKTSAPRRDSE